MKREFDKEKKLYTLSILVRDIPGVLSQVARLFSRKGYNIESIVSGETDKPGVTRITIVILADELMIDQIAAQCSKLIPVLAVKILDEGASIQREFALIKVAAADRAARQQSGAAGQEAKSGENRRSRRRPRRPRSKGQGGGESQSE